MNNSAINMNSASAGPSVSLIERTKAALLKAKGIITDPTGCWSALKAESGTEKELFKNYILILAALGPVCGIIGQGILGGVPLAVSISFNLVIFISSLLSIFVMSFVVAKLSAAFGGTSDRIRALRFLAYSLSASYVAGILHLVPSALFGFISGILSLYSLYLYIAGITPMLDVPAERKWGFLAASIVSFMIVGFLLALITAPLTIGASLATAPAVTSGTGDFDMQKFTEGLQKLEESMPKQ